MSETSFQLSGTVGHDIEWNFGSKLVMQVTKTLQPNEQLMLNELRFRCDHLCFNMEIKAHGYSNLQRADFTSVNTGQGDESPHHTLISNSSGVVQNGWISIYFHYLQTDPPVDITGPPTLHSSDGFWCEFNRKNQSQSWICRLLNK